MTEFTFVPRSVWPYFVNFLIVGLAFGVLGPALTDLREQSGADIGDIGILFVGMSAGYLVGSFTGGRLFDRFNGHRVLAGSLVLLGIGLALVPVFAELGALFATFVLIGFGGAICDVGCNTLLMWELGAGSGRAMNLLHLCFGIGALIAPLMVHIGLAVATRTAALGCAVLAVWAAEGPDAHTNLNPKGIVPSKAAVDAMVVFTWSAPKRAQPLQGCDRIPTANPG